MSDVNIAGPDGVDADDDQVSIGEALEPEDWASLNDVLVGDVVGDVVMGSLFGKIGHFISKAAKAVVHSPIVKVTAGVASIAFPPVGLPAATALIAADRIMATADGKKGTKKQQAAVKKAIAQTAENAKAGDPDAKRALEFMALSQAIRAKTGGKPIGQTKPTKAQGIVGPLVLPDGSIKRGTWVEL